MGQKDILERNLLEFPDVYADIWNVFAFHGRQVINPKDLFLCSRTGIIPVGGSYHEIIRDVVMEWRIRNCLIACLGVEKETRKDNHDGTAYA